MTATAVRPVTNRSHGPGLPVYLGIIDGTGQEVTGDWFERKPFAFPVEWQIGHRPEDARPRFWFLVTAVAEYDQHGNEAKRHPLHKPFRFAEGDTFRYTLEPRF